MTLYDHVLPATAATGDTTFVAEIDTIDLQRGEMVRNQSGLLLRLSNMSVPLDAAAAGGLSKRTMDIALSLAGIIALLPLFLFVAVLIKVSSPGPVFFRQQREGLGGRLFGVYKFRSMRADQGDTTGVKQTVGNDPRVTPLGRFLRKSSIDELPQLFNVLLGDMSLVGPRPHVPGMLAAGRPYADLVPYYSARHAVKPGLTGWAQVNGLRGPTTDRNLAFSRVNHDLAYIQNWSLALDIKILFLTVWRELTRGTGS